jgi:acyl transferase domain-containing protein
MYAAEECMKGNIIAVNPNYASIANRISYYLDFGGPSIALDTMCSSSSTAIHLACESIKRGECNAAIAGGVNITIHPNKYIMLSQGRFASSDGRCRSFGEGGDGYVPGEGVGAVLLKPLKRAIEDGDRIYSVIKGTSLNHGGKTNGYSVPNPNAQGELILDALEKANVNPRTISYIEAHGTGTSLGDPVEITGLQKAFGHYTQDKQFCSIGSSKSNIGHLESAAGIAAITKVILQMKYKVLVPSIHSEHINPNINFEDTCFYVQHDLNEWKRPVINGSEVPRRAGISSFGAGGSNAHIIMEEYVDEKRELSSVDNESELIILSAKDKERLFVYAQHMSEYLKKNSENDKGFLRDMAYTLQIGREPMEERIAIIVSSIEDLQRKLQQYVEGKIGKNMYIGSINREKSYITDFHKNNEKVEKLFKLKNYDDLSKIWISGENINWTELYSDRSKKIISLPVYPFARERYWIPEKENDEMIVSNYEKLHPLIGKNTSTLIQQKFSTMFTGKELIFKDHIVQGEKMMPAAAYLEMARAAGDLSNNVSVTKIKDIILAKPITINDTSKIIDINLLPEEEFVEYEVSETLDNGIEIIYSSGKLIYDELNSNDINMKSIDIKQVIEQCNLVISGEDCYEKYDEFGISYGNSFKVIKELYIGEDQSLASFKIPKAVKNNVNEFIMHPSIIDGMLQSVIGIGYNDESKEKLYLPFSIGEIIIINPIIDKCYGYAVKNESVLLNNSTKSFDIFLIDDTGNMLLKISDFIVKVFDNTNEII